MKKIISIILALVLLLGSAAAVAGQASEQTAPAKNSSPAVSPAENTYVILVLDADDSSPVSGAMVQFCSDTQCMVGFTDESGAASFEADPGPYTAHVLKAPEGYEAVKEEKALTADNRAAVFTLRKSGTQAGREVSQEAKISAKISFETTDLDGNPVTGGELFAGCKVAVIYVWATWSGLCRDELPELEKLSRELAGKNCRIIGVVADAADDTTAAAEAKKLLEEAGVTFVNIAATAEILEMLPLSVMPAVFFADSAGRVVADPAEGVSVEKVREKVDEALLSISE